MIANQPDTAVWCLERGHPIVRSRRHAPVVEAITAPAEGQVAKALREFKQVQAGRAVCGCPKRTVAIVGTCRDGSGGQSRAKSGKRARESDAAGR